MYFVSITVDAKFRGFGQVEKSGQENFTHSKKVYGVIRDVLSQKLA